MLCVGEHRPPSANAAAMRFLHVASLIVVHDFVGLFMPPAEEGAFITPFTFFAARRASDRALTACLAAVSNVMAASLEEICLPSIAARLATLATDGCLLKSSDCTA